MLLKEKYAYFIHNFIKDYHSPTYLSPSAPKTPVDVEIVFPLAHRIPSDNISMHSQTGATYNSFTSTFFNSCFINYTYQIIIYLMLHRLQDNIEYPFVHNNFKTHAYIDLNQ